MRRLRKVLQLSSGDRVLLISTVILLMVIRLGLWVLPFQRLLKLLARISQSSSQAATTNPATVRKVVWAVNVSSHLVPGHVKCLARALTTKTLLNRLGYSSDLRIGVAKGTQGMLEAHAWVEYEGQIVIGNLNDLNRFVPLPLVQGGR